jgi:hypothetical protein
MRHELIEALSGALFALALIGLERLLPFSEPYNVLAACIVGAIGFALLFTLVRRFRHLLRLDDLHHFEGDWLEEWHDGITHRYSIATIGFDKKIKQYILTGNSYNDKGEWMSRWASYCIFYDRNNFRLIYVSDGYQIGGNLVFGATCFHVDDLKTRIGKGFFVDDSSGKLERVEFNFKQLVGKDKLWTNPRVWIVQQHAARSVPHP